MRYQSQLNSDGKHKSYQECDRYKKNVIQMEKSIYLCFFISALSRFLMYETYYDQLKNYFTQDGIQVHYQDTVSPAKIVKTTDVENDLGKLQDEYKIFDFSNMNKDHKLFSDKFKKMPGCLKIGTPKSLYLNKFVCLRSKCYAYKTELDGNCNIFKGICKGYRKEISFEQYHNCLKNLTYNIECKLFCITSHDHAMYLKQITNKSLSAFNDKREYIDEILSKPSGGF